MATIVTKGGSVKCAHSGTATLQSAAKLTVSGQPALLFSGVASFTPISGCTFSTSAGPKPCTTLTAASGQSIKVTAGSQPVLLSTASITSDNPGPGIVQAGQSKLTAS